MEDLKSAEPLVGWRILSAVDEVVPGKRAKTRGKNWKSNYAPELILLEMMAQTAGLVVGSLRDFVGNVVFAKVENADFSECFGSYEIEYVIEAFAPEGVTDQGAWIETQVIWNAKKVASAKLFLIDAGDLSGTGKSLTFHSEFLSYYQVRKKIIA